jgi:hypothetical protein
MVHHEPFSWWFTLDVTNHQSTFSIYITPHFFIGVFDLKKISKREKYITINKFELNFSLNSFLVLIFFSAFYFCLSNKTHLIFKIVMLLPVAFHLTFLVPATAFLLKKQDLSSCV